MALQNRCSARRKPRNPRRCTRGGGGTATTPVAAITQAGLSWYERGTNIPREQVGQFGSLGTRVSSTHEVNQCEV
jgi:hypothetical protein